MNPITPEVQAAMNYDRPTIEAMIEHINRFLDGTDREIRLARDWLKLAAEVERLRGHQQDVAWRCRDAFRSEADKKHWDMVSYKTIFGQPFTGPDIEAEEVLRKIYGEYWK